MFITSVTYLQVSYHKFPTDMQMKKRWIAAIKRDEGQYFTVSKATKVCSEHFVESDFWPSVACGRRLLRDTAVPSVFAFRKVKPQRKPPLNRSVPPESAVKRSRKNTDQADSVPPVNSENRPPRQDAFVEAAHSELNHESNAPLQEIFVENEVLPQQHAANQCRCGDIISGLQERLATSRSNELRLQKELEAHLVMRLKLQSEIQSHLDMARNNSKQRAELEVRLNRSTETQVELQAEVSRLEQRLSNQDKELNLLRDELVTAQSNLRKMEEGSCPFGVEKFQDSDEDIQFYTGLPRYSSFVSLLKFLEAGEDGKFIQRPRKNSSGQPSYDSSGRKRKITAENQLFLVLIKLRLGLFHQHLAHLFEVSTSTVSRIFSSWVDFMYLRMFSLDLWLPRHEIDATMPPAFAEKYKTTRVLLDATEIRCDVPSSMVTQSEVYSHYKSTHTFKGLVAVAPSGVLTFASELFTGSTSDRECVIKSGFLDLEFEPGDSVMADKGFRIEDLLQEKGATLNIPPFLKAGKFTTKETQKTQEIAALRIHVERKIQRIKAFHVFDRSIPISLAPLANQMWGICAVLTNFQAPLLRVADD